MLLATGGFRFFPERIKAKLNIEYTRSNELEILDGRLSGKVGRARTAGRSSMPRAKRRPYATMRGDRLRNGESDRVGDGANDVRMMQLAGLAVAYRAKAVVREHATYSLNHSGLDGMLNWFTNGG